MATVSEPTIRDDESLYEIIDGQRVEMPPMAIYSVRLASRLGFALHAYGQAHDKGEAVVEGLFHLQIAEDRDRRPDVAFVSYERWPKGKAQSLTQNAWDVTPDLAVEVVSPNDLVDEMMDKIDEYFRAGVKQVWVVYPNHRQVHVFESFTRIRVLERTDTLDGGEIIPRFTLPLRELFLEESVAP